MPPKKDYGPPTRKSDRLSKKDSSDRTPTGESSITAKVPDDTVLDTPSSPELNKPAEDPSDPESEVPVTTNSNTESRSPAVTARDPDQDTPLASVEVEITNSSILTEQSEVNRQLTHYNLRPAPTDDEMIATGTPTPQSTTADMASSTPTTTELQATIARLQAELNARSSTPIRQPSAARDITPAQSLFGGTAFKPVGPAAKPEFAPFPGNEGQDNPNPDYDARARESRKDPGIFEGEKDQFDDWILKLAAKCRRDKKTFVDERDRMDLVYASTKGVPADLLRSRYDALTHPYHSTAEMIATLANAYFNANQSLKAADELRELRYNPSDDIHAFIAKVNGLAARAKIPLEESKNTLFAHIPRDLDTRLLADARDPTVTYERFCDLVTSAALSKQGAYEERRKRREKSPTERKARRRRSGEYKNEVKTTTTPVAPAPRPIEKEVEILKAADLCFVCKKPGHQARKCPDRKVMASLLASFDQRKKLQYQVSWVGLDPDETWYPAGDLKNSPLLLESFHKEHPEAAGPPVRLQQWIRDAADDAFSRDHEDDEVAEHDATGRRTKKKHATRHT